MTLKKSDSLAIVAIVSEIALVLILFAAISCTSNTTSNNSAAPTAGNATDLLSAKSAEDPALYLRAALPCREQSAFYDGIDRKTDSAFWTLQCTNGKGYLVEIEADVEASVTVTDCSILNAATPVKCLEKIK